MNISILTIYTFWISLLILVYTFVGYPILILFLGRRQKKRAASSAELPKISLIICAYNEENIIGAKIENTLVLDYPTDCLETIIVSDGSTDRTNEIMATFDRPGLKCITYSERGGKVKALNTAFEQITGDIIVFTDANVMFESDAIRKLVDNFVSNSIGCVVGNVMLRSPNGEIAGELLYSRYEKVIHNAEENWRTMITVDGAMYTLRRESISPLPPDIITDDWFLASSVLLDNKQIVFESEAIGYEDTADSVAKESARKVRMIAGGFQTAFRRANLFLNPFAYPAVCFMFVSHKLLRWCAGILMATLLVSNIPLFFVDSLLFKFTLILQLAFYFLALLGGLFCSRLIYFIFRYPFYFVSINMASIQGLFRYLTNRQKPIWEKSRE